MLGAGRDRLCERRADPPCPRRATKPAVLGRAIQLVLVGAAALGILYGTLGPLAESRRGWIAPAPHPVWMPPLRATNANDILTNAAVYFPVGAAICLLARRRGHPGAFGLVAAVLGAAGLSWVSELVQQFMPARVASATDILINVASAAVGAGVAPALQRGCRRLHAIAYDATHAGPGLSCAVLAFVGAAVSMTIPWIPRRPVVDWLDAGSAMPDLQSFALFAALGFLAPAAFRRLSGHAHFAAVLVVSAAAIALEAAQSVLALRVCSPHDMIVAALGGALGVALSARSATAAGWAAPLCVGVALVVGGLLGSELSGARLHDPRVEWIPFHAEFNQPFAIAASDIAQALILAGCLTLAGLQHAGSRGAAPLLILLVAGSAALELLRALLSSHFGSTSAPLLAAAGWLMGVRIWTSLQPRRAAPALRPERITAPALSSALSP